MEHVFVEFRAGKLKLAEGKLLPDPRKGLVRLVKTEDTLVHLQWIERDVSGAAKVAPEDDAIVFPEEAKASMIPGQRAIVIKFPDDPSRNTFFWLQEPKADGDDQVLAQLNTGLAAPLDMEIPEAISVVREVVAASSGVDVASAAGGVAPRDALEHAHMAGSAAAGASIAQGDSVGQIPAAPGQTPASRAAVNAQAANLAAILGNAIAAGLGGAQRPAYGRNEQLAAALMAQLAAAQGGVRQQQRMAAPGPSLAEVLRPEVMLPLLHHPDTLGQLAQHLPEEHRTTEALVSLAHSAQFQQQLATLSHALQSGQLDLTQFGLQAAGYSVADFLQAVQDLVDREARQQQQGGGPGPGSHGGTGGAAGGGGGSGSGGTAPMEQ